MIVVSAPLTEPIAIVDTFASGLARIEDLGACWRFSYFAYHRPLHGGEHDLERVIVSRIIMPKEAAAAGMMHAHAALGTEAFIEATH